MAGADYRFEPQGYDVATCIGASFVWGGFQPALQQLCKVIKSAGAVIIGEPYWLSSATPAEFARREGFFTEWELLEMARAEGFDMTYVARASHDEWDRYERENWQGLIAWLRENPSHPERDEVLKEATATAAANWVVPERAMKDDPDLAPKPKAGGAP
jgi:hypothetical protein